MKGALLVLCNLKLSRCCDSASLYEKFLLAPRGALKSCTTFPLILGSKSSGNLLTPTAATFFCRCNAACAAFSAFCASSSCPLRRRARRVMGLSKRVLRRSDFSAGFASGLGNSGNVSVRGREEVWWVGTLTPASDDVAAAPAVFGRVATCWGRG